MGQSHMIVNLTKSEYLSPECFGNGCKLAEIAEVGGGVMRGLAVLLAECNEGNGDYHKMRTFQEGSEPIIYPGEKLSWRSEIPSLRGEWNYGVVPECSGRWARDNIVITGEYKEEFSGMPIAMRLRARAAQLSHNVLAKEIKMNLYGYAGLFFKDISRDVVAQIKMFLTDDPTTPFVRTMTRMFRDKLCSDFGSMFIANGKQNKWDLTWMDYEIVDSFMLIFNEEHETLKAAKAWFRKQQILPWQRELIKLYRERGDDGGRPTTNARLAVMQRYGLPYSYSRRLLPAKPYLDAARDAELKAVEEGLETVTPTAAKQFVESVVVGHSGRADRMIDVEPQGKETDAPLPQNPARTRRANHPRKRDAGRKADAES